MKQEGFATNYRRRGIGGRKVFTWNSLGLRGVQLKRCAGRVKKKPPDPNGEVEKGVAPLEIAGVRFLFLTPE